MTREDLAAIAALHSSAYLKAAEKGFARAATLSTSAAMFDAYDSANQARDLADAYGELAVALRQPEGETK